MTYIDTKQSIAIEGIKEPAIASYFLTINQEKFAQTANLFAPEGELHAPFEKPIVGRNAIAFYLQSEARGMQLLPQEGTSKTAEDGTEQITVTGKVKTSLFSVNVAWDFNLNEQMQITMARIKLLASPQELLGLKKAKG